MKLKIPFIFGIDSTHGAGYIGDDVTMPHQINQAATFNTELIKIIGLFFTIILDRDQIVISCFT